MPPKAHGLARAESDRRRMGPRPDQELEHRRLDRPAAAASATARSRAWSARDAGEMVVADSTSINLFKVLTRRLAHRAGPTPGRKVIVSERSNFPTDLYIAESLVQAIRRTAVTWSRASRRFPSILNEDLAVLMITGVNYRHSVTCTTWPR